MFINKLLLLQQNLSLHIELTTTNLSFVFLKSLNLFDLRIQRSIFQTVAFHRFADRERGSFLRRKRGHDKTKTKKKTYPIHVADKTVTTKSPTSTRLSNRINPVNIEESHPSGISLLSTRPPPPKPVTANSHRVQRRNALQKSS